MRILMVDLAQEWRGGQSQALLLLQGLQARGHSVELLAVRGGALATRAAESGIAVHTVSRNVRRLGAAWTARRLLGAKRSDIVHVNEAHALTAAWLAGTPRKTPLVIARRVTFPVARSRISLARYCAAARIIAVSQAVRDELLAAGLDAGRIIVAPDGVEVPELVLAQERECSRERWKIQPDERVIALVASLTAEKGHALLLEAFANLQGPEYRKQAPRCRLLLAGDGPLRSALEGRANALGIANSVIFTGFVVDVRAIYAASDLFVFPSLQEGGGTSLLDAMAYSLPVIAAAMGGIKEIIEDGRNGLLLGEATPRTIAAAAARLLAEPEFGRRLGNAARATVLERFSAERMVAETLAIFEQAVSERQAAQST